MGLRELGIRGEEVVLSWPRSCDPQTPRPGAAGRPGDTLPADIGTPPKVP